MNLSHIQQNIRSYSWEIRGEFCAIKTVDKTLLKEGTTRIPNDIAWFFSPEGLSEGQEIAVKLYISDIGGNCLITKKQGRHTLFLKGLKKELLKLNVEKGDLLFFGKVHTDSNEYIVSVLGANNEVKLWSQEESKVGEDRPVYTTTRVNQEVFRERVMCFHQYRCCLSGVSDIKPSILMASHIKPWTKSDGYEKMDKYNGLLLTPHFDRLFDKGHISFKSDGGIILSGKVTDEIVSEFRLEERKLNFVPKQTAAYLEYHRHLYDF